MAGSFLCFCEEQRAFKGILKGRNSGNDSTCDLQNLKRIRWCWVWSQPGITYQREGASLQAALAEAHHAALPGVHSDAPPLWGVGPPGTRTVAQFQMAIWCQCADPWVYRKSGGRNPTLLFSKPGSPHSRISPWQLSVCCWLSLKLDHPGC